MADSMLQLFVRLTCTADQASNAHSRAIKNFVYVIQNDLLTDWEISLHHKPDQNFDFHRHASAKRPLFDDKAFCYENDPVPSSFVDALFNAKLLAHNEAHMTLKITYKKFSRILLDYMTRAANDLHNLADPDPPDKTSILSSFVEVPGSKKREYSYPLETREIKDIPCHMDSFVVSSTVRLISFHLDLQKLPAKEQRETILTLMAADHSRLLDFGADGVTGETKKRVDVWANNVIAFLYNYIDLNRARKLFDQIVDDAKKSYENAPPPQQTAESVILNVRNAIDARLITANHWADDRENEPGEEYQFAMSNVLGSILQKKKYASPVMLVRGIDADLSKPQDQTRNQMRLEQDPQKLKSLTTQLRNEELREREDWALFILQSGVGHCGEHANVSFFILRRLMVSAVSKGTPLDKLLVCIVLSGNANIQHDFVIGGMRPTSSIFVKGRIDNSLRPKVKKGERIMVLDLDKLLKQHPGQDGFVCDPYLAIKKQKISLQALLKKISQHPNKKLRTVAVGFSLVHPPDPEVPTEFGRTEIDGV